MAIRIRHLFIAQSEAVLDARSNILLTSLLTIVDILLQCIVDVHSESVLFIERCWKFYLIHGLRQLARDVKSDARILNFRSDVTFAVPGKTPNDVRRTSLCAVKGLK